MYKIKILKPFTTAYFKLQDAFSNDPFTSFDDSRTRSMLLIFLQFSFKM